MVYRLIKFIIAYSHLGNILLNVSIKLILCTGYEMGYGYSFVVLDLIGEYLTPTKIYYLLHLKLE